MEGSDPNSILYSQQSYTPAPQYEVSYGGFFKRLIAYLIDSILLSIVFWVVGQVLGMVWGTAVLDNMTIVQNMAIDPNTTDPATLLPYFAPMMDMLMVYMLISFVITWIYYAAFESSRLQATPGKLALGMIVTDTDGEPVGFGTATGRFLGKFVSSIILYIGFLMILFTSQKQGLHDKIAGTLVMNKPREI
jgi:uncharacterized RDD family membrane protein YckC